jgi:hypothetical protein
MPTIASLTPAEDDLFTRTVNLYYQAKTLIIYSEEIDPNSKINPQIWKELRDAFDHFMRVCGDVIKGGNKKNQNPNYYFENLDKAHGHVYRAAFDALDGASISIRNQISELAQVYDREILTEVIHDYWTKRSRLLEINSKIAELRNKKDVACDETVEIINEYVNILNELKDHRSAFLTSMPLLDECKKKHLEESKDKSRKERFPRVGWLLITIVLTAIITGLITTVIYIPWQEKIKRSVQSSFQTVKDSSVSKSVVVSKKDTTSSISPK